MNKSSNDSRGGQDGITRMMTTLPAWDSAVEAVSIRVASAEIRDRVKNIQNLYIGARGPMVVDVVASRRRRYETHVEGRIIPVYKENARDLSLQALADHGPTGVTLWAGESRTMVELAQFILGFAENQDDEQTIANFATQSVDAEIRAKAIGIRGIGPVLYEYLRLLSGVDTLKADSRVREALGNLGIPEENFSDEGILKICISLASDCGATILEVDQALWNR
jgi:hypothetical protein